MQQGRVKVDAQYIERATYELKSRFKHVAERYRDYVEDPQREDRLAKQECVSCYYDVSIAGAAMCSRQCADCIKKVWSGNTCVPILCPECAKARSVCRYCGAAMTMEYDNDAEVKRYTDIAVEVINDVLKLKEEGYTHFFKRNSGRLLMKLLGIPGHGLKDNPVPGLKKKRKNH